MVLERLAVVGLGYVGIPVACKFASAGLKVVGIDINPKKVKLLQRGVLPLESEEAGLPELLSAVRASGKLEVTEEHAACADADETWCFGGCRVDNRAANLDRYYCPAT
jgi:UDP-N-acetyl-D-mannosaminuronate dehydrogenase